MVKKKVGTAVLAWCLAMGAMAFVAPPAYADSPPKEGSTTAIDGSNDPYTLMVEAIGETGVKNNQDLASLRTWIEQQPGLEASGFYNAEVDVGSRTMTLLWKGPSSSLQNEIRDKAKQMNISAKVLPVQYNKPDVDLEFAK